MTVDLRRLGGDPAGAVLDSLPLGVSAFRALPGESAIVAADLAPFAQRLAVPGLLRFDDAAWESAAAGDVHRILRTVWFRDADPRHPAESSRCREGGAPEMNRAGWVRTPVRPAQPSQCEGAPFTGEDGRLLGCGDEARPDGADAEPGPMTRHVVGRPEIEAVIRSGRPLEPCTLLPTLLAGWGNPAGYESLVRFLEENGHAGLASCRIIQLENGAFAGTYVPVPSPEGRSRVIAVVSSRADERLDLELDHAGNGGAGADRGPEADAAVAIADPSRAAGATIRVSSNDRRSTSWVLLLEACPTGSGPCPASLPLPTVPGR